MVLLTCLFPKEKKKEFQTDLTCRALAADWSENPTFKFSVCNMSNLTLRMGGQIDGRMD